MVSCDARDHAAEQFLQHPRLIIEVLSPGTSAFDRGDKAHVYRRLPSLREYVLVDIDARRLELFRRTDQGDWLLHDCRSEQTTCRFECLELELPMVEIFEDVPDNRSTRS
jgi:Uma2 family endonuclease